MADITTDSWWAAIAGRWIARVGGSVMFLLAIVFIIGEFSEGGPPKSFKVTVRGVAYAGIPALMLLGLIVAWKWEGIGGVMSVVGYTLHAVAVPGSAGNDWLLLILAIGVTHVLCWLRIRAGSPMAHVSG